MPAIFRMKHIILQFFAPSGIFFASKRLRRGDEGNARRQFGCAISPIPPFAPSDIKRPSIFTSEAQAVVYCCGRQSDPL
jgi:hypothetical protein